MLDQLLGSQGVDTRLFGMGLRDQLCTSDILFSAQTLNGRYLTITGTEAQGD